MQTAPRLPLALLLVAAVTISTGPSLAHSAPIPLGDDYESRKALLLQQAAAPFVDDPMRSVETDLDRRPFQQINELSCPKLFDNSQGWSVTTRTGGRPFMDFDDLRVDDASWAFAPCSPGASGIPQSELDAHYAAGKSVNRLWFTHQASNGYPIVVVMTPDGFFNVAGATAPALQGAAARVGFIGEPFGPFDYLQHTDALNIQQVDDDRLTLIFSVHSEAGEGAVELELRWNDDTEQPELGFLSSHATRMDATLGFAGLNFMRGPTLSGLLFNGGSTIEDGIEAFHDGRTVFVRDSDGAVVRDLLIQPRSPTEVIREDIAVDVGPRARLELDQPQDVAKYFSRRPDPPYDQRTDLVLSLETATTQPIKVRRAQTAVDLLAANPEANETANVFLAADLALGQLYEFSYRLDVAAQDFGQSHSERPQGIVYVSQQPGTGSHLYFLPLDEQLSPLGPPQPLTDQVVVDPHNPTTSVDGRFVIFDADDYKVSTRQRVYTLDLLTGAVRRLSLDPFSGASYDQKASFNVERTKFCMVTNRHGAPTRLVIEAVATGLGSGFGNEITTAFAADWSPARNEIALASGITLSIYDVDAKTLTNVVERVGMDDPKFSRNGDRIAYNALGGLYVVNRDGSGDTQVHPSCFNPAWAGDARLIAACTVGGNTDLYVLDLLAGGQTRLTDNPLSDSEPAFANEIMPTVLDVDLSQGLPTLTWFDLFEGVDHYEVWRGVAPYFAPGDPLAEPIAPDIPEPSNPADPVTYTDPTSHAGDAGINDYYLVRALSAAGAPLVEYSRVAVFDFALAPGG